MTTLTEQWKKRKLPNGWYWVEGSRAEGIYAYTAEYLNNMYRPRNGEKIIEQVPSYEEWQAKLEENAQLKEYERIVTSYNMKPIDYDIACETVNKLLDEKKVLKEENTKLKELLKEVQSKIRYSSPRGIETFADLDDTLLGKINQVLGE